MHSKAKLGLAVLTSPTEAFEEITQRRLFGTALKIAAVAGVLSTIPHILSTMHSGPLQWLQLGRANPVVWMGLLFLYGAVVWWLLRWMGAPLTYTTVLTVMGWSQVTLALAQLVLAGRELAVMAGSEGAAAFLGSLGTVLQLSYILVMAVGLRAAAGVPLVRGILTYVMVGASAFIAFGLTYGNARFAPFASAPVGIQSTASKLIGADQTPWLAAAVAGLLLGIWLLARELEWDNSKRNNRMVAAGGLAAALLAVYLLLMVRIDFYGDLLTAQRLYKQNQHSEAALQMRSLLPLSRNNVELMLEIGHSYFAAAEDDLASRYYGRALDAVKQARRPDQDQINAVAHTGLGTVEDFRGRYPEALKEFDQAKKLWPELREPWTRAALTYDRMGRYDDAIKSANQAVRELESESAIAWTALAEAFVNKDDSKQAKAAIAMVSSRNEQLYDRIGNSADNWRSATDKLTRRDLKFPLEKELTPEKAPQTKAQKPSNNRAPKKTDANPGK